MCSDPKHQHEYREVSEGMARMETKLDSALTILNDHEARLRVAEGAAITNGNLRQDYGTIVSEVSWLRSIVVDNSKTIDGWRKVIWAIGTASFSGLGLAIWDAIKRGYSQ